MFILLTDSSGVQALAHALRSSHHPLVFSSQQVFIMQTVLSGSELSVRHLLLCIRFATGNQVLDPWVYILFRRAILKRIAPRMDWSRGSIISLYPAISTSFRKLTRTSLGGTIDRLDHVRPNPGKARQEDTLYLCWTPLRRLVPFSSQD